MPKLSPAALAVWEAFNEDVPGVFIDYGNCLAAALRAAAEECAGLPDGSDCTNLLTEIASELEGQ